MATNQGREIIFCSIGQCGVQAGNAAWELFCLEHSIQPDGRPHAWKPEDKLQTRCLFGSTEKNTCVPRAIVADLEPTVIDEIRTGAYRTLFHPDSLINSVEDAASNYARGYLTAGKNILNRVLQKTRQSVEACDNFNAFFIIHSVGGGTGAGFTNLFLEHLDINYAKRDRICVQLLPGFHVSTSVVEPYNVVLANHALTEHADVVTCFDNYALYQVCQQRLHIMRPNYNHLNRVIAQVYSDMTCCYRYPSHLTSDLAAMQTNMVPYPKIHYISTSYSPLVASHEREHTSSSVRDITRAAFLPDSMMCDFNFDEGLFMSCSMQYRGAVSSSEVNDAIHEIKRNNYAKFVDWNPTGFKIGLTSNMSVAAPKSHMSLGTRSLTMLANTTSISTLWKKSKTRFDCLYSKRAFVHWYVSEGMEEGELSEALERMESLIKDYKDLELCSEGDDLHDLVSPTETMESKTATESPGNKSENALGETRSPNPSNPSNPLESSSSAKKSQSAENSHKNPSASVDMSSNNLYNVHSAPNKSDLSSNNLSNVQPSPKKSYSSSNKLNSVQPSPKKSDSTSNKLNSAQSSPKKSDSTSNKLNSAQSSPNKSAQLSVPISSKRKSGSQTISFSDDNKQETSSDNAVDLNEEEEPQLEETNSSTQSQSTNNEESPSTTSSKTNFDDQQ